MPIITAEQWDAVHALLARDAPERKRVVQNLDAGLLRGLLFTADGERLVPGYTSKDGKRYRYYVSEGRRRYGAWSSRHGALPAGPLEELVTQQIVLALQAPHFVQAVVDRVRQVRPDMDEPEIVLPMRNLATMWRTLYPAEQRRLAQLLIERVLLAENGLEILWRDIGWRELAADLLPGSIGAELQELEAEGA
ncbi:MAG: DNA-invertase hin [Pseudomonadota bacterium]